MSLPHEPTYKFKRPFAENGDRTPIPDTLPPETYGKASLEKGFPEETQLPLREGGVAPSRLNFNGLLHALSAFAHFGQSGGVFTWSADLGYVPPAIVHRAGVLWWCLAQNGPETAKGIVQPGTDDTVWQNLFIYLAGEAGGGSGDISTIFGGVPVGTLIHYYGTSPPDGYLTCNGQTFSASTYPKLYAVLGKTAVPDLQGMFLRGVGGAGGSLGAVQNDAIRTPSSGSGGYAGTFVADMADEVGTGCFEVTSTVWSPPVARHGIWVQRYKKVGLNASSLVSWPQANMAAETRPRNVSVLICIKHD
jgi:hypothetical protein